MTCKCCAHQHDPCGHDRDCEHRCVCGCHPHRCCECCCECRFSREPQECPGEPSGQTTGNPRRPGKTVGTNRGRLPSGVGLTSGDLNSSHPPDSWAGQRKDLYLPYLFIRANAGDDGTRPVAGPFWESPDVLIMAGVGPSSAPPVPPTLGQVALAGEPNTLYAHVWNFGQSSAPQTVVESYWCNPSLGISETSAHLIAQTVVSLGARGSGECHALVKCPEAWTPQYLNGGHECLLVRAWDYTSDSLGTPPWDARLNRHVGQRNIHVIPAPGAASPMRHTLSANQAGSPLQLNVGPLYGAPADVRVERITPANMPWLQLHSGVRGTFPAQAPPTGDVTLSRGASIGGGIPIGGAASTQQITHDNQQVVFTRTDKPPAPGQAHVYRVTASQSDQVFGGYTVVVLGG
jgi:hypothetical protein